MEELKILSALISQYKQTIPMNRSMLNNIESIYSQLEQLHHLNQVLFTLRNDFLIKLNQRSAPAVLSSDEHWINTVQSQKMLMEHSGKILVTTGFFISEQEASLGNLLKVWSMNDGEEAKTQKIFYHLKQCGEFLNLLEKELQSVFYQIKFECFADKLNADDKCVDRQEIIQCIHAQNLIEPLSRIISLTASTISGSLQVSMVAF